jgi:hypothetical protein
MVASKSFARLQLRLILPRQARDEGDEALDHPAPRVGGLPTYVSAEYAQARSETVGNPI